MPTPEIEFYDALCYQHDSDLESDIAPLLSATQIDLKSIRYSNELTNAAPSCRRPLRKPTHTIKDITELKQHAHESFCELVTLPGLPRIHFDLDRDEPTYYYAGPGVYDTMGEDPKIQAPIRSIFPEMIPFLRNEDNSWKIAFSEPLAIRLKFIAEGLRSASPGLYEDIYSFLKIRRQIDSLDECTYIISHLFLICVQNEVLSNPAYSDAFLFNIGVTQYKLRLIEEILVDYLSGAQRLRWVTQALGHTPRIASKVELLKSIHVAEYELQDKIKLQLIHEPIVCRKDNLLSDKTIERLGQLIEKRIKKDKCITFFSNSF